MLVGQVEFVEWTQEGHLPSGKKNGNQCCFSPRELFSSKTAFGSPPSAETLRKGIPPVPNRMIPFRFQVPPADPLLPKSHNVCGVPPEISIFFSLYGGL
jgi:hypothetical protein